MKISGFLVILIFCKLLFAEVSITSQYFQDLKEIEILELMKNSPQFQQCQGLAGDPTQFETDEQFEKFSECFVQDLSKEDLTKINNKLKLVQSKLISSPETKNIRKYLQKRLQEGLYGENFSSKKLNKFKHVDQDTFLKLYKSHIGKTINLNLAEYCLTENYSDSQDKNIYTRLRAGLEKFKNMSASDFQKTKANFEECVSEIKKTKACDDLEKDSSSKLKRLCFLKSRLRNYYGLLNQVDSNQKLVRQLRNSPRVFSDSIVEENSYREGASEGEKKIDDLTALSLSDVNEALTDDKSEYFKLSGENFSKVCLEHLNEEECKKFVNIDEGKALNELKLKINLQYSLMQKQIENEEDKEKILKRLEDEGLAISEDEKEELNTLDLSAIKKKISEKYQNQKISIIHEINAKLEEQTLKANKNLRDSQKELKAKQENLTSKGDDIKGLVLYSNFVSQVFGIKDTESQEIMGFNTTPIYREHLDYEQKYPKVDRDAYKWIQNLDVQRAPASGSESNKEKTFKNFLEELFSSD
ncbi:MAG: hypothetical protein H6621_05595 [Halobacteriovoraceae bacterium]|nr:hypothetical protein [Halobacteriovoraceae bacterium]